MEQLLNDEDRLLVLGCKEELNPEEQELLQAIIPRVTDWNRVIEGAGRNRVLVQLAQHLCQHEIPHSLKKYLSAYCLRTQERVRIVKEGFEQALPVILEHHPRLVLLRGILYFYTLYAQGPKRTVGDLDLLVDKRPALSLAGYFRDHYPLQEEVVQALPKGVELEYHYDLNIYTAWGMRTAQISMRELWERVQPLWIGPHQVGMLSPEDNLLYLCHHNLTKGFIELYRFVDLYKSLQAHPMDWEELLRRARKYRTTRTLWLNGHVLEQIYGAVFPKGFLQQIQPPAPLRQRILSLLDFHSILHDPHPDLRYEHSSSRKNAKRVLLIMLSLVRPGNVHKILWAPFNRFLHALHYKVATNTWLQPLWGRMRQQLTG